MEPLWMFKEMHANLKLYLSFPWELLKQIGKVWNQNIFLLVLTNVILVYLVKLGYVVKFIPKLGML
jgi:hypothetical protein